MPNDLEAPKHPGGRPTGYLPEYCELAMQLGAEGKSPVQIAVKLGVPRTTMLLWGDTHPEFLTALTRAKELEQDWWENKGQSNLNADKFNAVVWTKSMQARFRDDYTETNKHELAGKGGGAINIIISSDDDKL